MNPTHRACNRREKSKLSYDLMVAAQGMVFSVKGANLGGLGSHSILGPPSGFVYADRKGWALRKCLPRQILGVDPQLRIIFRICPGIEFPPSA